MFCHVRSRGFGQGSGLRTRSHRKVFANTVCLGVASRLTWSNEIDIQWISLMEIFDCTVRCSSALPHMCTCRRTDVHCCGQKLAYCRSRVLAGGPVCKIVVKCFGIMTVWSNVRGRVIRCRFVLRALVANLSHGRSIKLVKSHQPRHQGALQT